MSVKRAVKAGRGHGGLVFHQELRPYSAGDKGATEVVKWKF